LLLHFPPKCSVTVPILLIGSDTEGRVFSEETCTVVLSLHGGGGISTHKLLAEQELVLRSLESVREAPRGRRDCVH